MLFEQCQRPADVVVGDTVRVNGGLLARGKVTYVGKHGATVLMELDGTERGFFFQNFSVLRPNPPEPDVRR